MTAAPVIAKSIKYHLKLVAPGLEAREFTFENKAKVTVGRASDCDIVIATDGKISRHHVEFRIVGGELHAVNVSGKNFIFVDGDLTENAIILDKAEVKIGDTLLAIELAASPQPPMALTPMSQGAAVVVPIKQQVVAPTSSVAVTAPLMSAPSTSNISSQIAPQMSQASMPRPHRPRMNPTSMPSSPESSGRLRFYMIVAAIGGFGYWFLFSETPAKLIKTEIRRESEVQKAITDSVEAVKDLEKQRELENSIQYRAAQEHYIKGFRDYRNGQYGRAMQSFSAALSLYSGHELARRYYDLSKRKFDELVQFHMAQGRMYYGKMNFRLCRSSYANVMKMLKEPNNQSYKEAKQYYDECTLRLGGRF